MTAPNPFSALIDQCHPDRTAEIIALRLQGLSERVITKRIGCNANTVHRVIAEYGLNGQAWFCSQEQLLRNATFIGWVEGGRVERRPANIENCIAAYGVKVRKL